MFAHVRICSKWDAQMSQMSQKSKMWEEWQSWGWGGEVRKSMGAEPAAVGYT